MTEQISSPLMIVFHDLTLGGIQKKVIDIIHTLQKQNSKIKIIICLRYRRGIFLKQIPKNVHILTPSFHTSRLDAVWFTLWLYWQCLRIHPKTILTFLDLCSIPTLAVNRLFLFWRKIKIIVGEDIHTSKYLQTTTHRWLRTKTIQLLYPLADKILVQTPVQKYDLDILLRNHNPDLVLVSPNWLPFEYQPNLIVSNRDIDILYVGRFDPQKNLLLFLKIIKSLPKLNVILVGDGHDLNKLKTYSQKYRLSVKFVPPTLNIRSYYLRSKIFLLTSHYEGFPLTVLEAIASGVLPIMNSIPEIDTFFGNNSPLTFTEQNDAVTRIKQFLHHPQLRKRQLIKYQSLVFSNQKKNFNLFLRFLY